MASPAVAATNAPPDWAAERAELKERIAQLEQQVAWFQRQIFGEKSERRHLEPPPEQMSLGEGLAPAPGSEPAHCTVAAHERRLRAKDAPDTEEGRLFFDEARVPVEVIAVPSPSSTIRAHFSCNSLFGSHHMDHGRHYKTLSGGGLPGWR